ncbi:GntR family transcriptional regulator [Lysinibacter cavernae]|uniref:DNA-binding GntR family transcriptional regulator n=1 Tax=Lysinibacter cavernae TaxID=1640652 RepID=A0A7X5TUR9_9MICO|nr:GntR family transcriptional regulator [Lysinibacter cavernae]NIH53887.1 DNA-binding GntR family transcriptional regulator [Lysinibacter cavernae]
MASSLFSAPAGLDNSLTAQVMNGVRAAIEERRMTPGNLYSVYQVAEELGISRSPVRDALLRLEEAGLIRFERNRGFRVLQTTPHDVAEIFAIRMALEIPAAHRAALLMSAEQEAELQQAVVLALAAAEAGDEALFFHHDQQIHDIILVAAHNERARQQISRLRVSTRLLGVSTAGDARTLSDIVEEHQPIIDGVLGHDPERAAAGMRRHLEHTGRLLVAQAVRKQDLDLDPDEVWDEMTWGF